MLKNKKMKFVLSMLMGISMVGTQSLSVFAESTVKTEYELIDLDRGSESSDGELIVDGGFEKGHSQWGKTGDGSFTDYPGCAATGDWCGLLPSNTKNACVYQVVSVKPNTDYVAKAKILLAKEGASAFFNIKTPNVSTLVNGAEKVVSCEEGQEWVYQDVELTFNTGDYTEIAVCAMKWTESSSDSDPIYAGQVYVDDVSLKEKNGSSSTPSEEEKYDMIWADDFNGKSLDMSNWGYELGCVRGCEQQHYVNDKENVFMRDGKLVLKATDRAKEDQYKNPRGDRQVIYNSGSVRTHGKQEFLYGRIEMRAKLPKGKGVFPAFWTLGSDFVLDGDINSKQGYGWARCGEIDIMELIGGVEGSNRNKQVWHTAHTDANRITETKLAGVSSSIDEDFNNDYHVFGINWSPNKLEWYVDNRIVATADYSNKPVAQKALNKPQYIQMNLAMGGNWPGDAGTDLAGTEFEIDYVYYAQNAEQKAAAAEYYKTAPKFSGLKNIEMTVGDTPDLLKGIKVSDGYYVDFSIDDEQMFVSTGGRTECTIRCSGKDDVAKLAELPVGTYNIHYSAIPNDVEFEPDQWDSSIQVPVAEKPYKFGRKTMTLTVVEKKPIITEGEKGQWTQGSEEGLTFVSDAKLDDFLKVTVNGKEISSDNYVVDKEKTIITLKSDYLKTLKAGTYTIGIVSKNGTAETEFTIIENSNIEEPTKPTVDETTDDEKKTDTENVKTNDNTQWMGYAGVALLSVVGVIALKKRKENS